MSTPPASKIAFFTLAKDALFLVYKRCCAHYSDKNMKEYKKEKCQGRAKQQKVEINSALWKQDLKDRISARIKKQRVIHAHIFLNTCNRIIYKVGVCD
jgi:hypothetical protein